MLFPSAETGQSDWAKMGQGWKGKRGSFIAEGGGREVRSVFGRRERWIVMSSGLARAWWEGKFVV